MEDEKGVNREEAQINGRTEGPFGTDDTDQDRSTADNKHTYEQENSTSGLDSDQVRGGQDGRNDRAMGSTDMDSKNGVLRMGDMDNSTMEVTQEGMNTAASGDKTNTAMVDVTTHGPDDYGSADRVGVPNAQKAAKAQNDDQDTDSDNDDSAQQANEHEVAETGTDLNNEPTY